MRAVVQRVTRASVTVEGKIVGEIEKGLVVLLGVARDDTPDDVAYLAGRMNLSLKDGGGMLVVSQFTLYGDVRRGLRPSWIDAAPPDIAERLYDSFVASVRDRIAHVATGSFRRMMEVELVNDGPVTILIDSRKTF
jgi:D-tyrosyl-tRNA(Tyr) deacylase